MITYKVFDSTREKALTREQGERVLTDLVVELESGDDIITVDFQDVNIITASFISSAFAQLYMHYPAEQLNQRLKIKNIPPLVKPTWDLVMKSAKGRLE